MEIVDYTRELIPAVLPCRGGRVHPRRGHLDRPVRKDFEI